MATVLENYYNLRSEVDQRIAQGGAPADAIWWHGEIVYRIGVLETCQMFCKTAPVTMEFRSRLSRRVSYRFSSRSQ